MGGIFLGFIGIFVHKIWRPDTASFLGGDTSARRNARIHAGMEWAGMGDGRVRCSVLPPHDLPHWEDMRAQFQALLTTFPALQAHLATPMLRRGDITSVISALYESFEGVPIPPFLAEIKGYMEGMINRSFYEQERPRSRKELSMSHEHSLFWHTNSAEISLQIEQKFGIQGPHSCSVAKDAISISNNDYIPVGILLFKTSPNAEPVEYKLYTYEELFADASLHIPSSKDFPIEAAKLVHIPELFAHIKQRTGYHFENAFLQAGMQLFHHFFVQDEYGMMASKEAIERYTEYVYRTRARSLQAHLHQSGVRDGIEPILELDFHNKAIEAFAACSVNPKLARSILQILQNPGAPVLLEKSLQMVFLVKDLSEEFLGYIKDSGDLSLVNIWQSEMAILKRLARFLEQASTVNSEKDAKKLATETESFSEEVIFLGSIAKGLKDRSPSGLKKIENIDVRIGYGNESPLEDWEVQAFEEMIQKSSPERAQKLIVKLHEEKNSENVKWFRILQKKPPKLIGGRKIEKIEEGVYIVGTFYVAEEFQNDFGIGHDLEEWTLQDIPEGSRVFAKVSNFESLERHLEHGNRIIIGVSEKEVGTPVCTETKINDADFLFRDQKEYPRERVIALAYSGSPFGNLRGVQCTRENLISTIALHTNQGFVGTRCVQQGDTFSILFERPKAEYAEIPYSLVA